ncbi:MAG: hypothetical protein IPP96_18105 [Chitinophagaceae bacterium]|nr:hypothetical protein [Chitinophagaceae bacterium]
MKTYFSGLFLTAGLFSVILFADSCAKADHSADLPKEQQVVGTWSINRIQLRIYQGGVFIKDTIIKQTPHPTNYVKFDAGGGFEYKFNTYSPDAGSYQFVGADSVVSSSIPQNYRWKMLTLTNVLFTVVSKGSDPGFPGAVVERYETFVR